MQPSINRRAYMWAAKVNNLLGMCHGGQGRDEEGGEAIGKGLYPVWSSFH